MVAGALAAMLSIPVAYHIYILTAGGTPPAPESPAVSTTREGRTSNAPPSQATPEPATTTGSVRSGCYNGDDPTVCTSAHTREIYPSTDGSCDEASLILHLGGIPGTDLLGPGLSIDPVADTEGLCSVTRQEGLPASSLKDLWNSDTDHDGYSEGGELRRCFNHQDLAVSCEDPHFSEEIYEGDQEIDCRAQYQSFTNRSAAADKNVRISGFSEGDAFMCRVEVQTSSESLVHSVRALGDRRPLIR